MPIRASQASDPKAADSQVVIRDFSGFEPNADPHDLAPGAGVDQVNVASQRSGELRVRSGLRVLTFD